MSILANLPRNGGAPVILIAALVALVIAIFNYLTPLTGINGTLGALLVCIASAALILDGACLLFVRHRLARGIWHALGFLGAVLTLVAAVFLHAWLVAAAMVVVLIGLIVSVATRSSGPSKGSYA